MINPLISFHVRSFLVLSCLIVILSIFFGFQPQVSLLRYNHMQLLQVRSPTFNFPGVMFLMNDWSAFFLFVPFCFVFFLFFWVSVKEGRKEGTKEGWKDGRKEASKEGRRNLRPTYMFFGHRSKTKLT